MLRVPPLKPATRVCVAAQGDDRLLLIMEGGDPAVAPLAKQFGGGGGTPGAPDLGVTHLRLPVRPHLVLCVLAVPAYASPAMFHMLSPSHEPTLCPVHECAPSLLRGM